MSPGDALAADYGEDVESSGPGRRAGVLLHPTSLPGPYGCGEIGREAFRFIDWLVAAGMQARGSLLLRPVQPSSSSSAGTCHDRPAAQRRLQQLQPQLQPARLDQFACVDERRACRCSSTNSLTCQHAQHAAGVGADAVVPLSPCSGRNRTCAWPRMQPALRKCGPLTLVCAGQRRRTEACHGSTVM